MSCKHLQRRISHQLLLINFNQSHRLFCSTSIHQNDRYIAPTNDEIEEYTQNIASVLHSWPLPLRDCFIATLHKAQANPRRNKNYDHLLTKSKIPRNYLQSLDYYKLKNWLPFIYANDIVQIMNEIQESQILALINDNDELITYDGNNYQHQQTLDRIKTEHYDKMIWIRDIPINVTDRKLAQIFSKFGDISAIIMDRYQSVRQQKWIKYKQDELKQNQKAELNKTIESLRENMTRNMINDYQQQYLKIEIDIDNNSDILRLIMAHLQHQFDINDIQLIDNETLLIPICLDHFVSNILSNITDTEHIKFYHEYGNIIVETPSSQEYKIRNALNAHRSIENVRRIGNYNQSKDGMIEMEISFTSKIESSIKDFIMALCGSYYNIDTSKVSISHHIPYIIPSWWRNMNEQTKHEFFSYTIEDTDHVSISQRMTKIATDGDEELAQIINRNSMAPCSAFIYFKDIEPVNTIICKHTKIWGMVINGERCRVSKPPTQITLKNVPYNPSSPIRYTPYYMPSTQTIDELEHVEIIYDNEENIVPPVLKRSVDADKAHIPIGSEHAQFGIPYINENDSNCNGLKAVYMQTTKFEHDHFSKESLDTRLEYEAPGVLTGYAVANVYEKTHLLMKHSDTINIGLPLIGGVIQYMLTLIPMNNHEHGLKKYYDGDSFYTPYDIDRTDKISLIKNMPIVANKVKINIDDSWIDSNLDKHISYIWKHASCTYEDNELFWYLDDDVNRSVVKGKKVKQKWDQSLFARMGYLCVYSKRYRKVNIISHGVKEWNGNTPELLQDVIDCKKMDKNKKRDVDHQFDDILDELGDWMDDEIEDNYSRTIAKAVGTKNISDLELDHKKKDIEDEYDDIDKVETGNMMNINDREFDMESGQEMFVYVNGIKHKFGDKEAMILQRGWNHILVDFGFNDINNGSFQIIDFNEKSEVTDLYWRYSPPPMSLILQFNDHINTMQMYDKLKTAKHKKYGIRVELCDHDSNYLENHTILQSQLIQDNKNQSVEEEDLNYLFQDDDIINSLLNDLDGEKNNGFIKGDYDVNGSNGFQPSDDRLLENVANGIVENIHKSNMKFDTQTKSKQIYGNTRKYEKMLSDYNPCQMLYNEDSLNSNTTEMFNTSLNIPSTLELMGNPFQIENEKEDDM